MDSIPSRNVHTNVHTIPVSHLNLPFHGSSNLPSVDMNVSFNPSSSINIPHNAINPNLRADIRQIYGTDVSTANQMDVRFMNAAPTRSVDTVHTLPSPSINALPTSINALPNHSVNSHNVHSLNISPQIINTVHRSIPPSTPLQRPSSVHHVPGVIFSPFVRDHQRSPTAHHVPSSSHTPLTPVVLNLGTHQPTSSDPPPYTQPITTNQQLAPISLHTSNQPAPQDNTPGQQLPSTHTPPTSIHGGAAPAPARPGHTEVVEIEDQSEEEEGETSEDDRDELGDPSGQFQPA